MDFRCDIIECPGDGTDHRCEHRAKYLVLLEDDRMKMCELHRRMCGDEVKVIRPL